jgi:SAM-dependent methyltransferase
MARTGLSLRRLIFPDATSGADQWQRVALNRAVDAHLSSLGPERLAAVEISGDAHAGKGWKRFVRLNYPEFDLCAPLAGPERFDVVICEQVVEHVVDPCAAAANLRGLCSPGGHVVVSTPFLIRVHEEWGMQDYWRFTPRGLRTLLERAGLEVDSVGSWGNRRCIDANLDRWPAYRRWHSLRNESGLPVQVWAFARNPADQTASSP